MGEALNRSAVRKDGTEFPVDIALSSIETSEGLLVSAAIRDITARIAAERERQLITEELHAARLRQGQPPETVGQHARAIAADLHQLLPELLDHPGRLAARPPGHR